MKKILYFMSGIMLVLSIALFAADKNQMAVEFIKKALERSKTEYGLTNALRYFQYTTTTEKNNPYSFILSSYGAEALAESKIEKSEKGKYIEALKDRSGARIKKLWTANKKELLAMLTREQYDNNFGYYVDSLITYHDSKNYKNQIAALKKKSPKLDTKTIDKSGEITDWQNYKDLAFWYRRTVEKNDKVVYDILKEIQTYYRKK